VCNRCGHTERKEEEVMCWKCGKGEMLYVAGKQAAVHLRKMMERQSPNDKLSDPQERNKNEHKIRQTKTGASREAIGGFAEATLLCVGKRIQKPSR
jgi:predicted  nucleic acid-binding Zn-ribbon protein